MVVGVYFFGAPNKNEMKWRINAGKPVFKFSRLSPRGPARDQNKLKPHRFIGIDLSGGKNDRTSVAILDYYPSQKKLFLTEIYEHIQQIEDTSADQALFEIVKSHLDNI